MQNRRWVLGLGLLAVYAPFSWLLFAGWENAKLWPVLPGLVISYLMSDWLPQSWLPRGAQVIGLTVTVLFVAGVLLALLRVRREFWALLMGVFVFCCGLAFLANLLMTK